MFLDICGKHLVQCLFEQLIAIGSFETEKSNVVNLIPFIDASLLTSPSHLLKCQLTISLAPAYLSLYKYNSWNYWSANLNRSQIDTDKCLVTIKIWWRDRCRYVSPASSCNLLIEYEQAHSNSLRKRKYQKKEGARERHLCPMGMQIFKLEEVTLEIYKENQSHQWSYAIARSNMHLTMSS